MRVPVTIGFGYAGARDEIGFMEIDESKLPKGSDYCFALGGQVLDGDYRAGDSCSVAVVRDFKLMQIAIVSDVDYLAFLHARQAAGCM